MNYRRRRYRRRYHLHRLPHHLHRPVLHVHLVLLLLAMAVQGKYKPTGPRREMQRVA